MNKIPELETERLILTWPSVDQIDQYHLDIIGTNMFDTIQWDGPEDENDIQNYWKDCSMLDSNDFRKSLNFAIIEKKSNLYIGGCSLRPVDEMHEIIDMGFALAPKFHGQGFATEAMKVLVNEAFKNREAVRVFGNVFVGNTASKRVFEKLGFIKEGTLRSVVNKKGKWLDEWVMGMTKEDWIKSKIYTSL
jgi:RimJ/RimL family protein N-acetyltransferase